MAVFTARAAARRLHRHERTIRRWIKSGRLRASHVAKNRFAIQEADLARLEQEEEARATPREQKLTARLTEVEHQVADLAQQLQDLASSKGAGQQRLAPRSRSRTLISAAVEEGDLPAGSRRAYEFAEAHGIHPKRFRYHLLTGLGPDREKVDHLAITKPGRPGEIERWLSPEQQRQALDFWQRHSVAFSTVV